MFCLQSKEKLVTFYFCPSSSKWMKVRTVKYTTCLIYWSIQFTMEKSGNLGWRQMHRHLEDYLDGCNTPYKALYKPKTKVTILFILMSVLLIAALLKKPSHRLSCSQLMFYNSSYTLVMRQYYCVNWSSYHPFSRFQAITLFQSECSIYIFIGKSLLIFFA